MLINLYHIADNPIDNIQPGGVLHLTPSGAWNWARSNNWNRHYLYSVEVPISEVQIENDRWTSKSILKDVVLTPYHPEATEPSRNVFDKAYLVTRRRKEPPDRFTSRDPYIPIPPTPGMISTEPPARIFRGPHHLSLQDMVKRFAQSRIAEIRLSTRLLIIAQRITRSS